MTTRRRLRSRARGRIGASRYRTGQDVRRTVYTIGFGLAVGLTVMSFWVANTSLLWVGGVSIGLTVLAMAQMGIHLVFFLHVTSGPDNTNNVMALAFGVLIVGLVVVGSLLIMADLNDSMMPGPELINLHMQR